MQLVRKPLDYPSLQLSISFKRGTNQLLASKTLQNMVITTRSLGDALQIILAHPTTHELSL
jgi:hypothetical protein